MFWICTVCKDENMSADMKVFSYYQDYKGGRVTRACCEPCHKKTHENWLANGWKLVEKIP